MARHDVPHPEDEVPPPIDLVPQPPVGPHGVVNFTVFPPDDKDIPPVIPPTTGPTLPSDGKDIPPILDERTDAALDDTSRDDSRSKDSLRKDTAAAFPTSQDDLLFGSQDDDAINGGEGNDSVFGLSGNDILFGGFGDDHLDGGRGNDFLFGGDGRDHLKGDSGDDTLFGGADADELEGGDGSDTFGYVIGTGSDLGGNRDMLIEKWNQGRFLFQVTEEGGVAASQFESRIAGEAPPPDIDLTDMDLLAAYGGGEIEAGSTKEVVVRVGAAVVEVVEDVVLGRHPIGEVINLGLELLRDLNVIPSNRELVESVATRVNEARENDDPFVADLVLLQKIEIGELDVTQEIVSQAQNHIVETGSIGQNTISFIDPAVFSPTVRDATRSDVTDQFLGVDTILLSSGAASLFGYVVYNDPAITGRPLTAEDTVSLDFSSVVTAPPDTEVRLSGVPIVVSDLLEQTSPVGSFGQDTIKDFTPGTDKILLQSFPNDGRITFADLDTGEVPKVLDSKEAGVSIIDGNTVIDLSEQFRHRPGTDTITVMGVKNLDADDFVLT